MVRYYYSSAKKPQLKELDEPTSGTWLHVEAPSATELSMLVKEYSLDPDLLNDGIDPNESPRIEHDKGAVYIFTRFCLPADDHESTAPLLIVFVRDVVITLSAQPFANLDILLADETSVTITSKRAQLILQILSAINAGYKRRINQVGRRILQVRSRLNKAQVANEDFVTFIDLEDELNDFLLVLEPMDGVLNNLLKGRYMRLYEEDRDLIEDLSLGTQELTQLASSRLRTLRNIREAYSTITANNLNSVFKLMTAVTILFTIFTVVTGIYSMNIVLPGAHNPHAFWLIMGITTLLVGWSAWLFRKAKWL